MSPELKRNSSSVIGKTEGKSWKGNLGGAVSKRKSLLPLRWAKVERGLSGLLPNSRVKRK
jgi:hypothetical protein